MHQTHCYCAYLQSCCDLFFVASLHPSLSFALFISPSFPPAIFICLAISLPSLCVFLYFTSLYLSISLCVFLYFTSLCLSISLLVHPSLHPSHVPPPSPKTTTPYV